MAKKYSRKISSVFKIFFESIKLYFLYSEEVLKHLAFPVFGQLFGLILIFAVANFLVTSRDSLVNIFSFLSSDNNFLIAYWLILSPFLFLFIKAFYRYITAFASLNMFYYTIWGKKKQKNINLKNFDVAVQRRIFPYAILMIIIGVLFTVPPICILAPITGIFLCLVFQIFVFEPDDSLFTVIARSIETVKNNFIPTVLMLFLCFITTYLFFPYVFMWASDKISLTEFITVRADSVLRLLPFDRINEILEIFNMHIDSVTIAKNVPSILISTIVISFSLPFRDCCFTGLYKIYDSERIKEISKESDEIIKRAKKRKN